MYKLQNIDHSEIVSLQDSFDNAILRLHVESQKGTNIKIHKDINKYKSDLKNSLPENTWKRLETFFHNTNTTSNKKANAFVLSELNLARHVKAMNDGNLRRYKYMLDNLESFRIEFDHATWKAEIRNEFIKNLNAKDIPKNISKISTADTDSYPIESSSSSSLNLTPNASSNSPRNFSLPRSNLPPNFSLPSYICF